MLDRIGDESIAPRDAGLIEGRVEDPPCRADEGPARKVLLVARLLPDQHEARAHAPLSWDDLGRRLVKRAACAPRLGLAQAGQRLNGRKGPKIHRLLLLWPAYVPRTK